MKKLLFLVLVFALLTVGAVCAQDAREEFVVGNIRDITMVNPFGSNTTENLNLFSMTHSHLLKMDPVTYEITPDLAERYEVSDDGMDWTFWLRKGVKFHNGDDCTADDVIYSIGLAKESSFTTQKVKFIETMEKIDDYTVHFHLSAPFQDMINMFAYPNICVVDEEAIAADPDLGYKVGTGPYQIVEWTLGDQTVVERFDDYYGELPKTKRFVFKLIQEDTSRVIALENGEIDLCIQPPTVQNSYIEDNDDLELLKVVGNKLNYFALNVEKPIFQNKLVRQAIAHAIDRESIILAAVEGDGTPANTVISPKTPFYNPDQEVLAYDPELSKQLLAEAGVDPSTLSFTIICNGSMRETIATVIQDNLKDIGITVEVQNLEASALKAQLNEKQHDAVVYNWGPPPGEGCVNTFTSLFYSGSGSNRTEIAEPECDAMIDAGSVEVDQDARRQIYYDLQAYLVDYGAFIPLFYETVTMGANADVQDFVLDVAECNQYAYAWIPAD